MASRPSIEDIEAGGEEFERIKQNFRSTVIAPDVSPNVPEAQTAFQELQMELQDFLRDHLNKIKDLQAFLSSNVATSDSNGAAHESHGTVTPRIDRRTLSVLPVDPDASRLNDDSASIHSVSNHAISRSHSASANKAPLNAHVQVLHSFLIAHAENIRMLQTNLQGGPSPTALVNTKTSTYGHAAPPYKSAVSEPQNTNEKRVEGLNQQFAMHVIISTFTAGLIVAFLVFVHNIIGTTRRTAFNVGMLFAFISLLVHLGSIIVAGQGASITAQPNRQHDSQYFKFCLATCEQLQFVALASFIVSVAIMMFLVFMSVAFPLVLLFLSAIGIVIVFSSTYWEVSVNFRNFLYLVRNLPRVKQSLEYLRIRGRVGED